MNTHNPASPDPANHGHANHDHAMHDHAKHADGSARAEIDPVCGMTVEPTTVHRTMHDGHEVVFCSAKCKDKFVAEPTKYTRHAPEPVTPTTRTKPTQAASTGTKYTCPMHPEIVRAGPGSCPICGMALEPSMPSLEQGPDPELRDMWRRFVLAAVVTAPLFAIVMADMLQKDDLVGLDLLVLISLISTISQL